MNDMKLEDGAGVQRTGDGGGDELEQQYKNSNNRHDEDDDDDDARVILHFDVDAMYVACERNINPNLRGIPVGVSQYNPYGDLEETSALDVNRRLIVDCGTLNAHQQNKKSNDANGSLIAVSYEARAAGVKRNDRGLEALKKCPSLSIVQVPVKRGKADLTLYRSSSAEVMKVLVDAIKANMISPDCPLPVEIASIDEVYVDVTDASKELTKIMQEDCDVWTKQIKIASSVTSVGGVETFSNVTQAAANSLKKNQVRKGSHLQTQSDSMDEGSLAWWHRPQHRWTSQVERQLAAGAFLAACARSAVSSAIFADEDYNRKESGDGGVYTLSAGIASNKTLAKLASGLKKPNRQTLIHRNNRDALEKLFFPLPLDRIRGLGGKLGVTVSEQLQVNTVGELAQISLTSLLHNSSFSEDVARFLYDTGRGICRDAVTERNKPKSIACGKTFPGKLAIPSTDANLIRKWTHQLCGELVERASADGDAHSRAPKRLMVHVQFMNGSQHKRYVSKSCATPPRVLLEPYVRACVELIGRLVDIETNSQSVGASSSTTTSNNATSSSKPPMKLLSIIGLTVAAANFEKVASGSYSIAAGFERATAAAADKVFPMEENVAPEAQDSEKWVVRKSGQQQRKKSGMDLWLSGRNVNAQKLSMKSFNVSRDDEEQGTVFIESTTSFMKGRGKATMDGFLTTKVSANNKRKASSRTAEQEVNAASRSVLPDGIDPDVWKELPDDIRASLAKEWEQRPAPQATNKKPRGIASFFKQSS